MRNGALIVVLLAGIFVCSPELVIASEPLTLTLEVRVELPAGQTLHLGELARIEGPDAKRAASITLGQVPGPGKRRALSAVSIKRALERAGFPRGSFRLLGATQPRVLGRGQPIDEGRVRSTLTQAIFAMVPEGKVRILDLQLPANVQLEPGDYQLQVANKNQPLRSGANRIPLEVINASGKKRRLSIYAKLEIEGPVLVAARDVPRGERIGPQDLRLERRIFPSGAPVLHDPAMAVGKAARSTLRVGQNIRASSLEPAMAVHSGQTVQATFKQGPVNLVFSTKARGKGQVGAIVSVVSADGRTLVRARVMAPGRVEVLGSDPQSTPQTTEVDK